MVRVRGVRGGGWKGEAVRRGVKTSDEDEGEDKDHGMTEESGAAILGSVRRLYRPETT